MTPLKISRLLWSNKNYQVHWFVQQNYRNCYTELQSFGSGDFKTVRFQKKKIPSEPTCYTSINNMHGGHTRYFKEILNNSMPTKNLPLIELAPPKQKRVRKTFWQTNEIEQTISMRSTCQKLFITKFSKSKFKLLRPALMSLKLQEPISCHLNSIRRSAMKVYANQSFREVKDSENMKQAGIIPSRSHS